MCLARLVASRPSRDNEFDFVIQFKKAWLSILLFASLVLTMLSDLMILARFLTTTATNQMMIRTL